MILLREQEFKFSHMGAAHKAKHNPTSSGKRMIETPFGNNAPTQVDTRLRAIPTDPESSPVYIAARRVPPLSMQAVCARCAVRACHA